MSALEKIQKILADAGLGSRREIERWIAEGRVRVNGKVASVGERARSSDRFQLDGKLISAQSQSDHYTRVLIYNKPVGEICTRSDPEKRPTVFDRLPVLRDGRWIVVGRLDINTAGLLLFTTDGALANRLMHPSTEMDREYVVRVMGAVDPDALRRLRSGVMLEDGEARFTDVSLLKNKKEDAINQWYCCTLIEGRNREVRRLWESQGYKVSRLKRVRFGPVHLLAKVKEGSYYEMNAKEIGMLYADAGLTAKAAAPAASKPRPQKLRPQKSAQASRSTEKQHAHAKSGLSKHVQSGRVQSKRGRTDRGF